MHLAEKVKSNFKGANQGALLKKFHSIYGKQGDKSTYFKFKAKIGSGKTKNKENLHKKQNQRCRYP